jgi:hypothetical protein
MSRAELESLPAGAARIAECYHAPTTYDVRLTCLDALGESYGVEGLQRCNSSGVYGDDWASYLNTGDSYTPTLIYWDGRYRVQSVGDFIETMERRSVYFN